MFWLNEEYGNGLADIVLDGVVCVVDALFGRGVSSSIASPFSNLKSLSSNLKKTMQQVKILASAKASGS